MENITKEKKEEEIFHYFIFYPGIKKKYIIIIDVYVKKKGQVVYLVSYTIRGVKGAPTRRTQYVSNKLEPRQKKSYLLWLYYF